jgi:hypothetical protein
MAYSTEETTKIASQVTQCLSQDCKPTPPECDSRSVLLYQTTRFLFPQRSTLIVSSNLFYTGLPDSEYMAVNRRMINKRLLGNWICFPVSETLVL